LELGAWILSSLSSNPVQYNSASQPVRITLNGDPYDLDQPLSVQELLERLNIDSRRVAVEHNKVIVKRAAFAATLVGDGDTVEIVNFVGGG
jgi:thiamine biosynthesis protein ThiS